MNQQCKVCGEPAAGFHFGAFTCEGCKSFFGRTYNNLSSISECKNNGECVINKKNRTACKACRLRKCLLVGMSKSGSRYGRRSNWFKIHCLLQEQQQHKGSPNNNTNSNSAILPNTFLPAHFLNSMYNVKQEPRGSASTPSDSGASSADPEEQRSNREGSIESSSIESKTDKSFLMMSPKTETTRTMSESLSPFVMTNGRISASSFVHVPAISFPPVQTMFPALRTPPGELQHEPIDLSLKSSRKRSRPVTPCASPSPQRPPSIAMELQKPAPLDLTLVRAKSLTG